MQKFNAAVAIEFPPLMEGGTTQPKADDRVV